MLENAILVVDTTIRIPFKVIRKNAHVNHSRHELIFISTSYFRLISIARWSLENCIFDKNDPSKTYILPDIFTWLHFSSHFRVETRKRKIWSYLSKVTIFSHISSTWIESWGDRLWFKGKNRTHEFRIVEYKKWPSVWRIWDNFVTDFVTTLFSLNIIRFI